MRFLKYLKKINKISYPITLLEDAKINFKYKKMLDCVKMLCHAAISFYLKKLNVKDDITINVRHLKSKIIGGNVELGKKTQNKRVYSLNLDLTMGYKCLLGMIAHELTHIKQIHQKELYLDDSQVVWKGQPIMNIENYKKKICRSRKAHDDLPFEVEAREKENSLLNSFLNSTELKNLKGKDASLTYIINYL